MNTVFTSNQQTGVATGWTDVHLTLARCCYWDCCKSGEFLQGVDQVWSLTRQSVPYVNFKVAILEFAYKWRWLWIVWRKYSTLDSGCVGHTHCSCVYTVWHYDLLTYLLVRATCLQFSMSYCGTTRQSRMWHRWQAWSRIRTLLDCVKLPWNLSIYLAYCTR